jgi:hypothetical protein
MHLLEAFASAEVSEVHKDIALGEIERLRDRENA